MRTLAFAIAAMASALAVSPVALADSWTTLTGTTTPTSTAGTSISLTNLGTLLTTISGSVTGSVTLGDPTPFSATYTESVYQGGTDAMCSTCLNFVYALTNSSTSGTDGIANISTTNFGSFMVAEGNISPLPADYMASGDEPLVGTIDLYLLTPITMGQTVDSYVLLTNASYFAPGTITFQDGTTGVAAALVAGTPEPSSLLLLGTGLLGVAFALFRKNSNLVMRS